MPFMDSIGKSKKPILLLRILHINMVHIKNIGYPHKNGQNLTRACMPHFKKLGAYAPPFLPQIPRRGIRGTLSGQKGWGICFKKHGAYRKNPGQRICDGREIKHTYTFSFQTCHI